MPYGAGIFLPSETAYKDPNQFKEVLRAEGNKEAEYLASMDQFYAQLEETQRQFDITSEMKDRQFEELLAFEGEKLDWQSEQNALDRSLKTWEIGQTTSVQKEATEASREATSAKYSTDMAKLDLEKRAQDINISTNEFMKGLYSSQDTRAQESHEAVLNAVGGSKGSTGGSGISGTGSYYNPFSNESISDWLNQ